MKSKFDILYEEILQDLKAISSKRKPIIKLQQMTNVQFLNFLRDILPYFKNGELNFNDISITEKIDGEAFRLVVLNNQLLFQNSRGKIQQAEKMPFSYKSIAVKELFENKFIELSQKINSDFKVIGQLIWCKDVLNSDNTVTPVGASYIADNFGTYGGMIIFEIKKIENNELVDFDYKTEQFILNEIKSFNNNEFKFYIKSDILLNKDNIKFQLDINGLQELLAKPEFNKESYSRKFDKDILAKIAEIRQNITNQLENIVNSVKGRFSNAGDLIEGIVIKNLNNRKSIWYFFKFI